MAPFPGALTGKARIQKAPARVQFHMGDQPSVSVVVPVYEDPAGVDATLAALTDQTCPDAAYEVVVVDNGSGDATPAVVESWAERHPALVSLYFETDVQGSYAARNAGIEAAAGEILAFLDADVVVDRTWVADVVARVEAGHDYVGCAVETPGDPAHPVVAYNRRAEFPVADYLRTSRFAPTCALAVRREVVETVGRFDDGLVSSGDKEFGRRVHDAGFDQQYAADVAVRHPPRSVTDLIRKYVRVGRGFEQVDRRHPDRFDHGPLVDPRAWLPTLSPRRLADSADEVRRASPADPGVATLVCLYALGYLTDLATLAGRVAERVRGGRRRVAELAGRRVGREG